MQQILWPVCWRLVCPCLPVSTKSRTDSYRDCIGLANLLIEGNASEKAQAVRALASSGASGAPRECRVCAGPDRVRTKAERLFLRILNFLLHWRSFLTASPAAKTNAADHLIAVTRNGRSSSLSLTIHFLIEQDSHVSTRLSCSVACSFMIIGKIRQVQ